VSNPGFPIGIIQVRRLKLLCYNVFHLKRMQSAFIDAEADLVRLTDVYRIKEVEDDEQDIALPDRLTSIDRVHRTFEALDAYFLPKLGASGLWCTISLYHPFGSCSLTRKYGRSIQTAYLLQGYDTTGTPYRFDLPNQ
jgi:hypothetical protein